MYRIKGKTIISKILKSNGKILMMKLLLKPKPPSENSMCKSSLITTITMLNYISLVNKTKFRNILSNK